MLKKVGLASLAIFITWSVLDFVIHELMLKSSYLSQPQLWRPEAEIKMWLISLVVFVSAVCFVYVYVQFISPKSMNVAVKYGLIFGIGAGMSFAYGTYAVQPVHYGIALTWFLGTVIQATIAGVLLGLLVKD